MTHEIIKFVFVQFLSPLRTSIRRLLIFIYHSSLICTFSIVSKRPPLIERPFSMSWKRPMTQWKWPLPKLVLDWCHCNSWCHIHKSLELMIFHAVQNIHYALRLYCYHIHEWHGYPAALWKRNEIHLVNICTLFPYRLSHKRAHRTLHWFSPCLIICEIFRQCVYVKPVLRPSFSQSTINSDGGEYGTAHRMSTLLLQSKHLIDNPNKWKNIKMKYLKKNYFVLFWNFINFSIQPKSFFISNFIHIII